MLTEAGYRKLSQAAHLLLSFLEEFNSMICWTCLFTDTRSASFVTISNRPYQKEKQGKKRRKDWWCHSQTFTRPRLACNTLVFHVVRRAGKKEDPLVTFDREPVLFVCLFFWPNEKERRRRNPSSPGTRKPSYTQRFTQSCSIFLIVLCVFWWVCVKRQQREGGVRLSDLIKRVSPWKKGDGRFFSSFLTGVSVCRSSTNRKGPRVGPESSNKPSTKRSWHGQAPPTSRQFFLFSPFFVFTCALDVVIHFRWHIGNWKMGKKTRGRPMMQTMGPCDLDELSICCRGRFLVFSFRRGFIISAAFRQRHLF